jgi:glycosyltransferase involved in cell wall biosynthesis
MTPDVDTWFVIAAFQEETSIADVVREIVDEGYPIVVVDDGSTDETGAAARRAGAAVVTHCINLGQGAAIQTGLTYALGRGAQFIVTFDADGQHQIKDALALLREVRQGAIDIAYGSRFLGTEPIGMTRSRRFLLRSAVLFTRITTGLSVTDAHCGLRVMNRKCAASLRISQNRMAHATQIPTQVAREGLVSAEFPVEIVYSDYSRSKGQRTSGSLLVVLDLLSGRGGS